MHFCGDFKMWPEGEHSALYAGLCVTNGNMLTHFLLHVNDDGDVYVECFRVYEEFLQT